MMDNNANSGDGLDVLLAAGVLFGSRALGLHLPDSDWDICVDWPLYERIRDYTWDNGISLGPAIPGYDGATIMRNVCSYKFNHNGRDINLIVYGAAYPDALTRVREVNGTLKRMMKWSSTASLLHGRELRCKITEGLFEYWFNV